MPIATINNHQMYYEIHGEGPPLLLMGGWGTYCHGAHYHLPRGLTDHYRVVIFDHRGIGESDDDLTVNPSMRLYADDAAGLLEHLGLTDVHLIGLVGMGACISQELAINRPDLVRSMTNLAAWARPDTFFTDQIEMLRSVHRDMGWEAFQKLVCVLSLEPEFYLANRDRVLGPQGPWREVNGRFEAHSRLIDACLAHDTLDRLPGVSAPTLIVHCPLDQVTGPRLTIPIAKAIQGAREVTLEGAAHVIAGRELRGRFAKVLLDFLHEVDAAQAQSA